MINDDGIKLHRPIWAEFEWLHDELVNGEHEQTSGTYTLKIVKFINQSGMQEYKIIDDSFYSLCKYDQAMTIESMEDGCFKVVRKPKQQSEEGRIEFNICMEKHKYSTIKEIKEEEVDKLQPFAIPF